MRTLQWIGVSACCFVTIAVSAEETFPKEMNVLANSEVRGAPIQTAMATTRLSRGDKVFVLHAVPNSPDWFAIKPPQGSFSWISGDSVERIDEKTGVVSASPNAVVKVLAGSSLVDRQPDVVTGALGSGAIILFVGPPLTADGTTWYPIHSLPTEVRYVHKSQLDFGSARDKTPKTASGIDETRLLRERIDLLEKRIDQLENFEKNGRPGNPR
jgi:hypothetical protein